MNAIPALCEQIQQNESVAHGRATKQGEAVARAALLVSVAAALILLFLFVAKLEPFIPADLQPNEISRTPTPAPACAESST